ncbi:MAG: acyl-CoA synthetase (AMP-forming)/AMP-acid ligase II [Candidatus Paceibacteria bacterium]|jgi:acyl-CoA synthetase (AMP-forming)/AMP-acid ligase II
MDPLLRTFLDLAASAPEYPAAVAPGKEWTRSRVAGWVHNWGSYWRDNIKQRRLGTGAIVAMRVDPGPGFLAAFLACRMAGACVLLLEPEMLAEEQQRVAAALGACALWNSSCVEDENASPANSIQWLSGEQTLPEAACLKMTSGSSGSPAGVITSPRSLVVDGEALIRSMGLEGNDRIFAAVSMSHAYGLSVIASPFWLLGCTIVYPGQGEKLHAARELQATVFPSVPSWYEGQLDAIAPGAMPSSLRLMLSAGAPLRPITARAWQKRHSLGIHVLYGSSECGAITFDRLGDAACRGSVGTPVEGVNVDLDQDGHVVVHSNAVALGYFPRGADRDTRITPGCFQTEDIASFDGEELHLQGRRSQWINVKGKKVNPREIEGVLEKHPAILEVAVIGKMLPKGRGEAIRAVIACEQDHLSFRDVVSWCQPRLSRHKYPRSVVFVRNLPRTGRGKLDRQLMHSL